MPTQRNERQHLEFGGKREGGYGRNYKSYEYRADHDRKKENERPNEMDNETAAAENPSETYAIPNDNISLNEVKMKTQKNNNKYNEKANMIVTCIIIMRCRVCADGLFNIQNLNIHVDVVGHVEGIRRTCTHMILIYNRT